LKMGNPWANPNLDREMKNNLESKVEDFLSSGKGTVSSTGRYLAHVCLSMSIKECHRREIKHHKSTRNHDS
jgi:hypothetical protein